jgi:transposase
VAAQGLATDKKRVRRQRAHLVLIDESGLLLAPLRRRSQAPRGQTPLIKYKAKHREKVSLLAALTLSPRRGRAGLYFSSLINDSFEQVAVAWFLRQLLRHLRGRVIVLWDRGPMHQGPEIRAVLQRHGRLQVEELPPYAPELNPVETIWKYLKWDKRCNWAPADSNELEQTTFEELRAVRSDRDQLRSFWEVSDLPIPKWAFAA